MPRIARAVALEFPHHVVQRGNNRENVFINEEDKKKYLSLLKKYSAKWDTYILAYCLMSNHVHLLTRPIKNESLYKMMQGITLCYTQYFNRTYRRTGRLWESRYHSCVVDKEKYLWAVARYIEQNPVRAKIVKKAADYPYSSARAHIQGLQDEILGEALFESRQMKDYVELMKAGIKEEEVNNIRNHTRNGRPIGSESFIVKMERKLDRIFKVRPRGRPKKGKKQ
jgi:putative transposase